MEPTTHFPGNLSSLLPKVPRRSRKSCSAAKLWDNGSHLVAINPARTVIMPIRFRCAYCNQLMGIAKRKIGSVVTCPKCGGQVVVPTPDPAQEEPEQSPNNPAAAFEEDDEVQKLLEYAEEDKPAPAANPPAAARKILGQAPQPAAAPQPLAAPQLYVPMPPAPVEVAGPQNFDVVPVGSSGMPPLVPARGVYLTPGVLSIVLVLVGLLVGLAFFLGFLLGRS
jgi:hypothetical protein